jgi:hypothetical protein
VKRKIILALLILLGIIGVLSNIFTSGQTDEILTAKARSIYGVKELSELNIGIVTEQMEDLFEDKHPNTVIARVPTFGYFVPFILIYSCKYKYMFYGVSADGPPKFRKGYVFVINFFGYYAITDFFMNLDVEIPVAN